MALVADAPPGLETEAQGLAFARSVLDVEAQALLRVRGHLDGSIARAANLVHACRGATIVTGMGKAGLVGQKLAATLASTGTTAFPLHPADAVHGDLGRVRSGDVVIALSQSGETEEVLRLLPSLRPDGGVRRSRSPSARPAPWAAGPTCAWRWGRSRRRARWAWRLRPAPRR